MNELRIALYDCVCYLVDVCQCVSRLAPRSKLCLYHAFQLHRQTWSSGVSLLCLQYESDELEKSVYLDYDSDSDVPEELKQDYVDEQTGDAPLKRSVSELGVAPSSFKCTE